jgi:hypothetical protein
MMLLSELVKLDTKKLNAMKKEDIVKSITGYGFQYTNMEKELAEAKKEIARQKAPYDQVKLLALGALNITPELDEYSKKPILESYDLCYLIGQLVRGVK